jgi:hypothetical protein
MESARERGDRLLKEFSKALPRVFGDPLLEGIGKADPRLVDESPGHIAAYALGFVQELAVRVAQCCKDTRETENRKREACQLLVNVATDAVSAIYFLVQKFPESFRSIAQTRANFPWLVPARSEQRSASLKILLEDLAFGKLYPLKVRSESDRKTFSLRVYVNSLLYYYIRQAHAIRRQLLAIRHSDPSRFADIQRLEIERIVDDVPLCIANAKKWMGTIWELLLKDFPQPETHEILRRLGYHRRKRTITRRMTVKKKSQAANIRDGIKHALSRYFVRMLRAEEPLDK